MKKITRRKFIKKVIFAIIGLFLLDTLWFEKYIIEWNYFDISKNKKNRIKIIQISDLHINSLHSFHRSIAKKINSIKPDLIFITGDSVNTTKNIETLNEFLVLIDKSIQKYAIIGNREYKENVDLVKLKNSYKKNNCELLVNENRNFIKKNRSISIIGMDDLIEGNPDFNKSIKDIKPSDTNVVLIHCPEHRDLIEQKNGDLKIDLILSGHTHGGQISFFGYALFKPIGSGKYIKGWYKEKEPKLYVSKGIGTSYIPIRFGSRAEMVVLEI